MNRNGMLAPVALLVLAWALPGCSSSRDVEVKGSVSAASNAVIEDKVVVQFFDVIAEGEEQELSNVHSKAIGKPGAFSETISVEGDSVLVRAIDDVDGDGACTEGEAWSEAIAGIKDDDTVDPVALELDAKPCVAD